ncbi:ATPase [Thermopolyspora sp. NPDC052614]|uniref:ATP-binding protein n=1 Tax=Thermopolyspora sp. NPDC052614 TaxID=3155682 RepID=UPI003444CD1E
MGTPTGWRQDGNLPMELTGFVGRARLLATIKRRLAEHRLVTVTGIGGVGKSRTTLRVAHTVRHLYPDGVWFVDLARLRDPTMVPQAVAAALGLADPSRPETEMLADWALERRALLVLDACEHLIEGCAELTESLLRRCGRLRMLVTSRQSLGVPGEHTVPVPPLALPGDDPAESPYDNESVRLFAERASAAAPDFVIDDDNIEVVSELCRRLDGIPLAIELAAVRLRTLSPRQMLALLTDRFSLLTGASRTALPRHRTLRAAIGWSHELCEPGERLLWARLSLFAGDFDLDAVRNVCAGEGLPGDRVMELVAGLVEKSILLSVTETAGVRYRLIDTLREYGLEWLTELGEAEATRKRLRGYYLRLAEEAERAWSGSAQVEWFLRLRQERDNIRAALDYCLAGPDPEAVRDGLRMISSLWFMWAACGFAREGRVLLDRAIAAAKQPSPEKCKALWVLSYVLSAQGDVPGAIEAAERCKTEALLVGDHSAVILATKMLGTAALLQGDLTKAQAYLGVAIELHQGPRELNPGLLPAIVEQSMVLNYQGRHADSEELLNDCRRLCLERGELWLRSYAAWATALTQRAAGRIEEAVANAKDSLRIKRLLHDVLGVLIAMNTLAALAMDESRAERAAILLGASEANWRRFGGLPQLGAPILSNDHDRCVKECQKSLGEDAYQRAFDDGARMNLDEAIAFAIDDLPPHPTGRHARL